MSVQGIDYLGDKLFLLPLKVLSCISLYTFSKRLERWETLVIKGTNLRYVLIKIVVNTMFIENWKSAHRQFNVTSMNEHFPTAWCSRIIPILLEERWGKGVVMGCNSKLLSFFVVDFIFHLLMSAKLSLVNIFWRWEINDF